MGIPSFFSYIVKNHIDIIKKKTLNELNIDNLYLDCNSIIYDVYSKIITENINEDITINIIRQTICIFV